MTGDWEEKVKGYCEKYNIPLLYLAETLYEPKVVPMIRGKAFEFSVMMVLQNILPKAGIDFLHKIGFKNDGSLQDFAFQKMYVAKASDLTIGRNGIICTRALCKNKKACGFIPNYPIITFDKETAQSTNKWVSIEQISSLLKDLVRG